MNRDRIAAFILIALNSLCSHGAAPAYEATLQNAHVRAYFSPDGGATDAIVNAINGARQSVRVLAYSFTSAPIAKALVDAHNRGVDVQVILDKSQRTERYSGLTFLQHAGVPVRVDAAHQIAHNKVCVVDGRMTFTGSFNLTKNAEFNNAENLFVVEDPGTAAAYTKEWQKHFEHSEP